MDAAKRALLEHLDQSASVTTHQKLFYEMRESLEEFVRLIREPIDEISDEERQTG